MRFAFFLAAATLRAQVSPVQKVIELLDQLKGKVAAELEQEEALMEEYTSYCDTQRNEREDAITSGERTITDLSAVIQDSSAAVSTLTAEVEDLAGKITASSTDLDAATKIRDKERTDFEATEKELSETVDTIERAIIVLKRGQTFLQKKASKEVALLAQSLTSIISASWVSSHDREVVQSLLQSQDQDEDLSLQPQATVAAYESKGGGILEVLADMQQKASTSLSALRKEEMESQHKFDMLRQQLETEISSMDKRKNEATGERTTKAEQKAAAEGDKEETSHGVASDKTFLKELKLSCSSKAEEWAARQKDAAGEMAAIAKAKEVLSSGVKGAFLQSTVKSSPEDERRSKVTALLRGLQKTGESFSLTQLVSAAQSDPFGKVRELIESLIERLMKEAGEEADAKAFCDKETSKSKAKQADLTAKVDQNAVRVEKSEAGKAKLASQIKALQGEIAQIDAGMAEATKLRSTEHEDYTKASAEYQQSADAVANAMQVLQDYYSGQSFLQVKQAPEFGGAKSDIASTILEMLEVAEQDFTRLLAETEASENSAASTYKKLEQENAVAKASKQEEVKGKSGEQKSLEMALLNYKEDYASTNKELDATLAYLDKLKPQCETKVMSFEERTQRREQEIAGLKEALTILEAA